MARSQSPVIVWFRRDLRLADNAALTAAAKSDAPLFPLYILDDENSRRLTHGRRVTLVAAWQLESAQ